jgi:hypothetical protein
MPSAVPKGPSDFQIPGLLAKGARKGEEELCPLLLSNGMYDRQVPGLLTS